MNAKLKRHSNRMCGQNYTYTDCVPGVVAFTWLRRPVVASLAWIWAWSSLARFNFSMPSWRIILLSGWGCENIWRNVHYKKCKKKILKCYSRPRTLEYMENNETGQLFLSKKCMTGQLKTMYMYALLHLHLLCTRTLVHMQGTAKFCEFYF